MKSKIWIYTLTISGLLLLFSTAYKESEQKNTVIDYDGNVYHTVKIGTQTWMVQNLRTTHYRNGDPITHAPDNKQWFNASYSRDSSSLTGAYCNYDNDPANAETYGRLYNKEAVTDSRGIAPAGWHLPTGAEWKILQDYLVGANISGGKMKEAGTKHWVSPNKGATNSSGFTGLPGGFRFRNGVFGSIGFVGYMWSSGFKRTDGTDSPWFRLVTSSEQSINHRDYSEANGFSVRCIKDSKK